MNSAKAVGASDAAQLEAGFDDDGGADTPADAQDLLLTSANSNQLEVAVSGVNSEPQLKQTILKTVAPEKIGDLLIANGYAEASARMVEAAAKAAFNVQTLPAQSAALATGARDAAGDYRAAQLAIYENNEYVGTIALAESGLYGEGAQPTLPPGLLDDSGKAADAAVRFDLADGVYSAGLRNGIPEPVIREAIQLIGGLTDLKSPLLADQAIRVIFTRDYRDKAKSSGRVRLCRLERPARARSIAIHSRRRTAASAVSNRKARPKSKAPNPRPGRRRKAWAKAARSASAAFSRRSRALL